LIYLLADTPKKRRRKMFLRKIVRSTKRGSLRKLVFTLIMSMTIIGMLPNSSIAGVISADEAGQTTLTRADGESTIRATLERKEIAARLTDYGLTPEEVSTRLDRLSDGQVAEISARIDKINEGGDLIGSLVSLALLVLIVLLVLHLLGYIDLTPRKVKA
jgi:Family of unknown function (DUF6627)